MHYVGSWPTGVGSIVHIHSLHMEHNLFETGIGKGKLRSTCELSSAALVDLTKLDGTESASVCLILTKLWRWFWSAFRVWSVKKWFWKFGIPLILSLAHWLQLLSIIIDWIHMRKATIHNYILCYVCTLLLLASAQLPSSGRESTHHVWKWHYHRQNSLRNRSQVNLDVVHVSQSQLSTLGLVNVMCIMRCQVGKKHLLFTYTCMAIIFSLIDVIFYHIGTI